MDIEEFGEDDVFVNVHGYDRWDRGITEDAMRKIAELFPGKIYGIAEEGFEDQLHTRDQTEEENIIRSREEQGRFDRRGLGIENADHVVLAGGEYGFCHNKAYRIIEREVDDAEFIFPPEACFGLAETSNPDLFLYTFDEFQSGDLPVEDTTYFVEQIAETKQRHEEYDWSQCSIQPVLVE